jgi:ATP-binding cassette subfamily F protein 3
MSLVSVHNLSLFLSGRTIFDHIGIQVNPGDRIGLVGRNGSGKTTLLRLLAGKISPDKGEVRIQKGICIGYLPQDLQEELSGQILSYVLDAVPGRVRLNEALKSMERAIKGTSSRSEQTVLAEELAEIHQNLDQLEFRFPTFDAEKILLGLGFQERQFQNPVSTLSGGWKMRAALAALLHQRPDLLLLDEPTNHLDIPSVRWLEKFLREFSGAMVLVSHDRDFLNRQIARVISFEVEGMRVYSGDYDFYLNARSQERHALEAQARSQEQKIKEAKRFVERFKAKASKARQAQSKIKLIRKETMIRKQKTERTMKFAFPQVKRSGREVVSIQGLAKGFGGETLYTDINLTVFRGDRVAVIGPNGCGKTTLLRMIAGELKPDEGRIVLGHEVQMGYFAQHHSDMLNPQKTVIEEVYQVVPHESISFVRGVCGSFLFSGEEVDKQTGVLSGGEKARVALAKLMVNPGNLMVMDEPTNHLDIASADILTDALGRYEGTLMFVSHNQAFVNRLANKIWDIRGGEIEAYPGTLYEYYDHLNGAERQVLHRETEEARREQPAEISRKPDAYDRRSQRRERAERRRLISDSLEPLSLRLKDIEEEVTRLEAVQGDLEKSLADPEVLRDKGRTVSLMKAYHETKEALKALLLDWEQCQDDLDSAKKKLEVVDQES